MKVWFSCGALAVVTLAGSAEAAVFGVPAPLSTDGRICVSAGNPAGCPSGPSIDPPGYFVLTGTAAPNSHGDAVHQLRLFIEVVGPAGASTLDFRVFDAGDRGARVTENRLARFSANPGAAAVFTTGNTGTRFTGLNPGLCEFRVTMENGAPPPTRSGVEVTDGAAPRRTTTSSP